MRSRSCGTTPVSCKYSKAVSLPIAAAARAVKMSDFVLIKISDFFFRIFYLYEIPILAIFDKTAYGHSVAVPVHATR